MKSNQHTTNWLQEIGAREVPKHARQVEDAPPYRLLRVRSGGTLDVALGDPGHEGT